MTPATTIERVIRRLELIKNLTKQLPIAGEAELAISELGGVLAKLD